MGAYTSSIRQQPAQAIITSERITMGKIVAIDPGDRWIGIAISDPSHLIARPLKTVELSDLKTFFTELFAREQIDLILIGHPMTLAGKASQQTLKIIALKEQLENIFPLQKFLSWDERHTSQQAAQLQQMTRRRNDPKKKEESHALAATFILDSYLMVHSQITDEEES